MSTKDVPISVITSRLSSYSAFRHNSTKICHLRKDFSNTIFSYLIGYSFSVSFNGSFSGATCDCASLIHLYTLSHLTYLIPFTASLNSRPTYKPAYLTLHVDISTCIKQNQTLVFFSPKPLHLLMFYISENGHFPSCQNIYEPFLISLSLTFHI